MKMFKKLKNKKSVAITKTTAMTETTPTISKQNKPDTPTSNLVNPDITTLTSQPIAENTSIHNEKLNVQKNDHPSNKVTEEKPSTVETTTLKESTYEATAVTQSDSSPILNPASNNPAFNQDKQAIAATPAEPLNKPAKIKLTGRMLNFTRLHITGSDFEQIHTQLQQKFANQPNSKMLVVLSCEEKLNLAKLLAILWELGLQPIGIVTGQMDEQANEQKLAIFPADGKRIDVITDDKKVNKPKPIATPAIAQQDNKVDGAVSPADMQSETPSKTQPGQPESLLPAKTEHTIKAADSYISSLPQTSHLEGDLIYTTMLRSGQSINHVGGDLVLTQGINAGAEAITDYSLHVYGKAEGRLVAGATGDEKARIFCLRFNPSLVSVAGTFCLRENIPSEFLDKAVQVRFEREKGLIFTLMNG